MSCGTGALLEQCTAVGHYVNSAGTEVTLATGRSVTKVWSIQEAPNPTGAKSSSLSGISCVGGEPCTAVGHYVNSGGTEVTLAEHLATKVWSIQETPNPTGAKNSSLLGVSCTGGEACTGVGHYVNSGGTEVTLAERLATKVWSIQETPNPTGAKNSGLAGVLCTGAEACVAVGGDVNSASVEVTLAESWNGKTWSTQEPANPKIATGSLSSVSCPSSEACIAVGHYTNEAGAETTLAESWNGIEWALQETVTPTGAKSSSLSSVSCTGTEACTAVGHYVNSSNAEVTLAEVFASKKWALQETVTPTGAKSSSLSSVSCTGTEACTAVGHYVNSSNAEVTLAEVFASKKWALQETVTPTGAKSSSLSSVSCTGTEACTAVGHYVNSSNAEVTLAEVFASKKWALQETVTPTGAKSSSLSSVSCTGTEACTAVGHYVNSSNAEVTLAEVFASKKWALQETVTPTGAKSSSLSSVSCTGTEACTAVGHYVNSSNAEVTLAEVFASKKWALQESPNGEEAKSSSLAGVSCKSAETCIAVGHYATATEVALVEEHAA